MRRCTDGTENNIFGINEELKEKRDHLKDLKLAERIILIYILNK
jgi:hypothetical protein